MVVVIAAILLFSQPVLAQDTDGDGLKDGIEVMGWDILVVNRGVQHVHVLSLIHI